MAQLARDPKLVQLARELGLSTRGDCLAAIRQYALMTVSRILEGCAIPVNTLDALRRVVANKYSVKLETIAEDADVTRIAAEHQSFHPHLERRLATEFHQGTTEGITLERDLYDPLRFRYLAVVDSRGDRSMRAYFTGWHELTHLVVHPEQLRFPGFRRTPPRDQITKDPLESLVDHIAGRLAFYPPLFQPAIAQAMDRYDGALTFGAIDAARMIATPSASLFAATMGSINFVSVPILFVAVGPGLKAGERRRVQSSQQAFPFADIEVREKLRALTVVPNEHVPISSLSIRRNMRVPTRSVLTQAFGSGVDVTLEASENQSWWETSDQGSLPSLSLRVQAVRRGRFVYGLIAEDL